MNGGARNTTRPARSSTAKPNNFDGSAVEVIAQKLGLIIYAESELV